MKTEVHLTPETEEEVELLERLAEVREFGLKETDLDRSSVAGLFAQMSAGIAGQEDDPTENPDGAFECPECGQSATDATGGSLGEDPQVIPCGCETSWSDLPADLYLDD